MSKLKLTSVIVVAIVVVVLLFPVSWSICPSAQIKVTDEKGNPVTDCRVNQSWQFYGLSGEKHEAKQTDAGGLVQFQARATRIPIAIFLLSRCASALNVHSSFGPSVRMEIWKYGFQRDDAYYSSDFKESKISIQDGALIWNANLKTDQVYEASLSGDVEKLKAALKNLDKSHVVSWLDNFDVNRIVLGLIGKQGFKPGVRAEIVDLLCHSLASDAGVSIALTYRDENNFTPLEMATQAGDSEMAQILETKRTR